MQFWLSEQARLSSLILLCALLWTLESIVPLYMNIFSFWDRLCGTYTRRVDFGELRYGLDGFDDESRQSLRGLLKMPFVKFE